MNANPEIGDRRACRGTANEFAVSFAGNSGPAGIDCPSRFIGKIVKNQVEQVLP